MKTNIHILLITLLPLPMLAMEPQEIADKASATAYYQGDDGKAEVQMSINDSQGRERERRMVILRKDESDLGKQNFFVFFTEPSDVSDTTFLVNKVPDEDDDRWIYLPALDLVRRIAASDVRSSFVGSHFFYEDVSGRSSLQDEHTLDSESDTYYVLESTPKDPKLVEFEKYKTWIHKETFMPVKTEYYNDSDEMYRSYEVTKVETIDGFPTVMESKMTNEESGGYTVLSYQEVEYNVGLPDSIFSERYLRNPPQDHL